MKTKFDYTEKEIGYFRPITRDTKVVWKNATSPRLVANPFVAAANN